MWAEVIYVTLELVQEAQPCVNFLSFSIYCLNKENSTEPEEYGASRQKEPESLCET